jgi:hypothetical protein
MEQSSNIRKFRWAVFLLAAFYFCYAFTKMVPSEIGWQFRFLTNWALAMSFLSAFYMLQRSLGRREARHEVWASTTVVLNIMVVVLYWKIYFADPSQFYENGVRTIPLWQEYYLHLVGPILQWIDAFFILGAFRPIKKILTLSIGINLLYIAWIEGVVQPLNSTPLGTITSGLPYRFLNNLELGERGSFYLQNTIAAIVMVILCWSIATGLRKLNLSPK